MMTLDQKLEKPKSLEEQITTLIGAIAEATVNASNVLNQGMGALARTSGQAAENIERAGEVVLNLEEYRTELLKEIAQLSQNKAVLAGETEIEKGRAELEREEKAGLDAQIDQEREVVKETQIQRGQALAELRQLHQELLAGNTQLAAARAEQEKLQASNSEAEEKFRRLEAEVEDLQVRCDRLRAIHQDLEARGRPLMPYDPPERLPRIALRTRKFGTSLPELDYRALLQLKELGRDIATILVASLRNYLPHESYRKAIAQLNQETLTMLEEVERAEEEE